MSAQALYVVRYTLSKNGGVVHTLTGGARGPAGGAADVAEVTHAATSKATPVDADELPLADSAATFALKKLTWANLKATLKAYFDTLYQPLATALTSWAGVTRASGFDTFAATPSSANLRALVTDETGTGALVFGTAPTFTTGITTPRVASAVATDLLLAPGGNDTWYMGGSTRHLKPYNNNSFDLGAAAETVRTGYFGTSIETPQIKFPATQSASSDPNTLDDYEEGTFTPALTFGGASTGIAYQARSGIYTKVGNRVDFKIYAFLSSKGTATGVAAISGLPFVANSTIDTYASLAFHASNMISVSGAIQGYITPGGSSVALTSVASGAGTGITDANFNNSSSLVASGTYFV